MFDFIIDENTPHATIGIGIVIVSLAFYGLYDIIVKVASKYNTRKPKVETE